MKTSTQKIIYSIIFLLFVSAGCKKNEEIKTTEVDLSKKTWNSFSITPVAFNWETVDWMPTPPGQSQIPPPWIGQGSIASVYGLDVADDYKAVDGWTLLYSTFDANASGPLVNPYFILYNKFTGLMRVYMYTTTQFIYPSTYIIDGLSVLGSSSSILNFASGEVCDPDPAHWQTTFSQVEPAPKDGSQPLASNKWYMLQYEIAYDPNITSLTSGNVQLSWFSNFNSISNISLGGTLTGTVKTPTAAPKSDLQTALSTATTVSGKIGVIGKDINSLGDTTHNTNTVGLPNQTFKNIVKAVGSVVSAATGGVAGAVLGVFNAIFTSSPSAPKVNLNFSSTIKLSGTATTVGSFPSSPTSLYVPGSIIQPTAQNYIPLSNDPLGVFNLKGRPIIDVVSFNNQSRLGYLPANYTIQVGYRNVTDENDLRVLNPSVFNNSPSGATLIRYLEEPIFIMYNTVTNGGNVVPNSPTIDYSPYTLSRLEDKEGDKVISTTDDLSGDSASFNFISQQMSSDLEFSAHTGFVDPYITQGCALRVTLILLPNAPGSHYITLIKTFQANVRCHIFDRFGNQTTYPIAAHN